MKKQQILIALGAMFLASCADTWDREYSGINPQKEGYEYLAEYLPLKEYVDRSAYPNFKLGIATSVSDYNQQQLVYALVNSNADETVAGNAMKMASCVDDKGNMSFDNAVTFVNSATDAGLNVYGHTLAWHAQQPVKYLTGLLKDKELDIDPDATQTVVDAEFDYSTFSAYNYWGQAPAGASITIEDGVLKSYNPAAIPNFWEFQYHVADGINWVEGINYNVTMMIRASEPCSFTVAAGTWGGQAGGTIDVTTEWQEVSVPRFPNVSGTGFVMFQSGNFGGTIEMKWLKITHEEAMAVEVEVDATEKTYTDGKFPFYPMGCEPPVINGAIHFEPTEGGWFQFFIFPGGENQLEEGDYVAYLDMTSSATVDGVQITIQNGWGGDAQNITLPVSVQEGQQVYKFKFPDVEGGAYDVILKPCTAMATLDVRSIAFKKIMKMNSIPLTPEEKKDTLTWAMDRWIGGMMQAMEGKVKAWDVVNEAISGGNADAEGVYALQHANGDESNFFWQDYMGDLDYVRTAVASARKHFEANGGTPSELKLFVNDYNLESDWDQNGKLKSLIKWIERWEADGVTKIDGIGSQMHISCYADANIQESKKNAIVESFKLMAATGKLVRISELDMGYVGVDGNSILTPYLTEAQHKEMAELYKFVVSKYLEIIPKEQQWGICQWAATDSPAGSGWRGGEPIGLWDEGYNRKHTYAGWADGLSGK